MVRAGRFIGWYVRWKDVDGRRKMRASHQPTRAAARRLLIEIEARVMRGQVGIPEPAPLSPTVGELCERFLREYSRPRIKDLARYRAYAGTALRRALPLLGELRADAVKPADLHRLRESLLARGAASTAALTLSFCRTLFGWAAREGIVNNQSLRGLELPPRQEAVEYLSAAEVRALLTAAEQRAQQGQLQGRMLAACVSFAVFTGLRKGELLGLRWRDLDLDTGRLSVCRSFAGTPKNNKIRHLRLPEALKPALLQWQAQCPRTAQGLVFPRRRRDGTWAMAEDSSDMLGLPALLAAAGCRPIARAWHALRHTFASHYVMQGGSLLALSKILGHSDIKMTMIYAHLAPDFIGEEMNRVRF
jgi:integrase